MNDLITVIVPAYNAERYIERCLESIINQTHQNLEILCIDDGSTDKTSEVASKIKDSRIKIINRGQNYGLSPARNLGIELAKGDYIGFIDADDYIDLDFYEKMYLSARNNDAEIVMADTKIIWPNTSKLCSTPEGVYTSFSQKMKVLRSGSSCNKLYKADIIKKHNLQFPIGVIWEDNPFVIEAMYFSKKMATVTGTAYNYIMHQTSITHSEQHIDRRKHDSLIISRIIIGFINSNSPKDKNIIVKFILKNIVLSQYFSDNTFYLDFKKIVGPGILLYKARFKALKKEFWKKIGISN